MPSFSLSLCFKSFHKQTINWTFGVRKVKGCLLFSTFIDSAREPESEAKSSLLVFKELVTLRTLNLSLQLLCWGHLQTQRWREVEATCEFYFMLYALCLGHLSYYNPKQRVLFHTFPHFCLPQLRVNHLTLFGMGSAPTFVCLFLLSRSPFPFHHHTPQAMCSCVFECVLAINIALCVCFYWYNWILGQDFFSHFNLSRQEVYLSQSIVCRSSMGRVTSWVKT